MPWNLAAFFWSGSRAGVEFRDVIYDDMIEGYENPELSDGTASRALVMMSKEFRYGGKTSLVAQRAYSHHVAGEQSRYFFLK